MRERGHSIEKNSIGNLQTTSPDKLSVIKDKRESNMSGPIQNDTVTPVQCIVEFSVSWSHRTIHFFTQFSPWLGFITLFVRKCMTSIRCFGVSHKSPNILHCSSIHSKQLFGKTVSSGHSRKMLEDMSMFLIWLTHYDSKSIQSSFNQKHSIILYKTV